MEKQAKKQDLYWTAKQLGYDFDYKTATKQSLINFITQKQSEQTRRIKPAPPKAENDKEKTEQVKVVYEYPAHRTKNNGEAGSNRTVVYYKKTEAVKPREIDEDVISDIVKDYKAKMPVVELLRKYHIGSKKLYKVLETQGIRTYHYGKAK
jgi:hypothetical protein